MPWLKFYEKERQQYPEAFTHKVSDEGAKIIVKKLKRHFKIIRLYGLRFYGNSGSGSAYPNGYIRLSHNPSVGMICHEVAHLFNKRKYGNWNHNKKLMRTIKRMVNYCKRKNYWQEEIARRTEN